MVKWKQLQCSALLLSLVLVFAQTVTQQHIHTADAPAEGCVVCIQGDLPAAVAATTDCRIVPLANGTLATRQTHCACHSSTVAYLTRAPPYA